MSAECLRHVSWKQAAHIPPHPLLEPSRAHVQRWTAGLLTSSGFAASHSEAFKAQPPYSQINLGGKKVEGTGSLPCLPRGMAPGNLKVLMPGSPPRDSELIWGDIRALRFLKLPG